MEIFLNSAWALLAVAIIGLWLRFGSQTGARRRTQFVALAVLILTLFPVISVTDDLVAMQNPAEVDACQRRDHLASAHPTAFPAVATLPPLGTVEPFFGVLRIAAPGSLPTTTVDSPALASIQSRPPPSA